MFYSILIIIALVTVIRLFLMQKKQANISVGQKAPLFELPDETNTLQSLADYQGKKVILYFYPKDNTPGCTSQACSLRDGYQELVDHGYTIFGISFDAPETHLAFKKKNNLPFHLLSDTNKTVAKEYGALMMGGLAPQRKTFVIDKTGIIRAILTDIDVKNHAQQLMHLDKQNKHNHSSH